VDHTVLDTLAVCMFAPEAEPLHLDASKRPLTSWPRWSNHCQHGSSHVLGHHKGRVMEMRRVG
jgi:hypothetical protein